MPGTTTRPRTPRTGTVLLASALAGTALFGLAPAADAVAPAAAVATVASASGVTLLNSTEHVDPDFGDVTVAGLVQNTSVRTLDGVRVVIDQLDAQGNVLFTVTASAVASRLDAGDTSAFKAYLAPVEGYASWRIRTLEGDAAVSPANHNFTVLDYGTYLDEDGLEHLEGVVVNDNTASATVVTVGAAFLDAAGKVVDADLALVETERGLRMAPGEIGYFDFVRFGGPDYSSVELVAEAGNDPSPLPVTLALTGGATIAADAKPRTVPLTATVLKRGTSTPVAGAPVDLQSRTGYNAQWVSHHQPVRSDAGGTAMLSQTFSGTDVSADYRATIADSASLVAATSGPASVVVNSTLAIQPRSSVRKGKSYKLRVTHRSGSKGTPVLLQERVDGRWVDVARGTFDSYDNNAAEHWSHTFKIKAKGSYGTHRFRAVAMASTLTGPGTSKIAKVLYGPCIDPKKVQQTNPPNRCKG